MSSVPGDKRGYRLSAIDMIRGLVIVIMAIDHVRDMVMAAAQQDPMADPNVSVGLFATRWTGNSLPLSAKRAGNGYGHASRCGQPALDPTGSVDLDASRANGDSPDPARRNGVDRRHRPAHRRWRGAVDG